MLTPRSANRELKRQKKANELLMAAERLIQKSHTINGITVDLLRAEAGMARSTFYVYFEDKIDFISVLMNQLMQETHKPVQHWWLIADHGSIDELTSTLLEVGRVLLEHRIAYQLIVAAALSDEHLKQSIDAYHQASIQMVQQSVQKAQAGNSIRKDVTAEMTESLHWMAHSVLTGEKIINNQEDLNRYCGALAQIMWRTLFE
jgi:AcrR family transcriptional regulator|tara:strand:+ start:2692 stop:3300 length:609 start_codon:yes stop_codon:yes gene_type:complete